MVRKQDLSPVSLANPRRAPSSGRHDGRGPRPLCLLLLLTVCLSALSPRVGLAAPVAQQSVMVITSPTEGTMLSGQVEIRGTATHPNFNSYGVLYASGARVTGETNWRLDSPIAWNVPTMVVNGVLGTWDTTQVPNGQYVLALAVFEVGNETPMVYFINNLTVNNEEATPTPEPTETPEAEEPGAEPTADEAAPPPAAPTIALPPTSTPRPTATIVAGAAADEENDGDDGEGGLLPSDIFSVDAVKEAFKTGAQLALLIYAVGILYALTKAAIRYYLRQTRSKSGS
ncbi:MAG: hypothetical protein JXC32_20820 [Anaerolineae bacterium]|nr:hypothetical protein [Anaerolineae bacterium]